MNDALSEKIYALFSVAVNKKLVGDLGKKSAKVFLFPPVETEKFVLDSTQTRHLKTVADFDWIIFTDVFAVDYFLQNLEENGVDCFEMDAVRVCALGEAVSDRLRFVQLHADVIPNSRVVETVVSAVLNYANNAIKNLKFLVVKESSGNFSIAEKLIKSAATVLELPIYQAKITNKNEIVKLKTLLKSGAIDEFVFTSAEDFLALQSYFPAEAVSDVLAEIKISTVSEVVFQTAKEYGLRPHYFHL